MKKPISEGSEDCLFCKIVAKKIPSKLVYEDEAAIAFQDIHPQAPTHLLIVPKKHFDSLLEMDGENREQVGSLFSLIPKLARQGGLAEGGFRTVINSGRGAGQTVFHLHIHLLGGRPFRWPPG